MTPRVTPRQALVRVARFHMKLASDDLGNARYLDLQGPQYMCSIAVVCLDRALEQMDLFPTMVLCDQLEDRLEVRVRGVHVFCRDMCAESAPWIEVLEDLEYQEVSLDEAE